MLFVCLALACTERLRRAHVCVFVAQQAGDRRAGCSASTRNLATRMGYTSTRPPLTKCKNFSRRYSDPLFSNSAGKEFEVSEESSSDDDDDDDGEDSAIKSQSGQGLKRKVNIRINGSVPFFLVHCVSSLFTLNFPHHLRGVFIWMEKDPKLSISQKFPSVLKSIIK